MRGPRGVDLEKLRANAARVQRGFWPKFRRVARRLPFAEDLLAAYFCAVDGRTPLHVKAVLMGALAYFVMPTDMIPDFIAGFGFSDDAAVLMAALRTVSQYVRPEHRERAATVLADPEAPQPPPDSPADALG